MKEKIKNLIKKLNEAREAYYIGEQEIMSNKEYDDLFDELVALENETGIILPDSPTQNVGADVTASGLSKVKHEKPALSLDKKKVTDPGFLSDIKDWIGNKDAHLSFKLDGLTTVLTYDNGKLTSAVTRGNGIIGEDITKNAAYFRGIPQTVDYKNHLVLRGESLMRYSVFNKIKESNPKYKNPRNLASGTVRALDPEIPKTRQIDFVLFEVVEPHFPTKETEMNMMGSLGFTTVPSIKTNSAEIESDIEYLTNEAKNSDFPTDGLVLTYQDVEYAEGLGSTGHHAKGSLAIKWGDETAETILKEIEWSLGRTGVLTPVAIFEPVELEGTTVSRASLHNLTYIMEKDLRIGDTVTVYKANMIIPQIGENLTGKERNAKVTGTHLIPMPKTCPCCGEATGIHGINEDVMTLHCNNPFCANKQIKKFVHMCERDCLNIVGLSEEIITKLVDNGFVTQMADIFTLDLHPEIAKLEGFGEKSYKNLLDATNKARYTDFVSFIHAMGIPNVGKGQAKLLKKYLDNNYDTLITEYFPESANSYDLIGLITIMQFHGFDWSSIEGFGPIIADSLMGWITNNLVDVRLLHLTDESDPACEVSNLLKILTFIDEKPVKNESSIDLTGKIFVITGDVHIFKNRTELQEKIESLGGKASSSVSSKTSYLINNDINSTSGKNKKAKELGIPIISEEDFQKMIK